MKIHFPGETMTTPPEEAPKLLGFADHPKVEFENHVARRIMEIQFPEGCHLGTPGDVAAFKKAWMGNLKSWHSPYTCLLDLQSFSVSEEAVADFTKMLKFFKSFFLKSIVGYGTGALPDLDGKITWECVPTYEEARAKAGLDRSAGLSRNLTDLRQRIQIENDFTAHVMEISFLAETRLETKEDISILKSKVTNILMQWHTPYSVMVQCNNLTFSPEAKTAFEGLFRFLKSFFCKELIGYAPKEPKETYPFPTFRSRHLAAGSLDHQGLGAGDKANCASKTTDKLAKTAQESKASGTEKKLPSSST